MELSTQPSLDELIALYAAGPEAVCAAFQQLFTRFSAIEKRVVAAEALNSALQLKVDELTARLNKDSLSIAGRVCTTQSRTGMYH